MPILDTYTNTVYTDKVVTRTLRNSSSSPYRSPSRLKGYVVLPDGRTVKRAVVDFGVPSSQQKEFIEHNRRVYNHRLYSTLPITIQEVNGSWVRVNGFIIKGLKPPITTRSLLYSYLKPYFFKIPPASLDIGIEKKLSQGTPWFQALLHPVEFCLSLSPNYKHIGGFIYTKDKDLPSSYNPTKGITFQGNYYPTYRDLAVSLNLNLNPFLERLKLGLPLEDAVRLVKDNPTRTTPRILVNGFYFKTKNSFERPIMYIGMRRGASYEMVDRLIGLENLIKHPNLDPILKIHFTDYLKKNPNRVHKLSSKTVEEWRETCRVKPNRALPPRKEAKPDYVKESLKTLFPNW